MIGGSQLMITVCVFVFIDDDMYTNCFGYFCLGVSWYS